MKSNAPLRDQTRILLVEDSGDDALFISSVLQKLGLRLAPVRVRDGDEAITYLSDKPLPDLVLLDLKMPKLDGFDVLACMHARTNLKNIPVVVLSGSDLPEDKAMAKHMGARDYIVKIAEWDQVATALENSLSKILSI